MRYPKWEIGAAILKGKNAGALMKDYGDILLERLQEGEMEQLEANVAELEKRRSGQPEAVVELKSKTAGQDTAIDKLSKHVSGIRKIVKAGGPKRSIKESYGIGVPIGRTVFAVNASANMVKTAYETHSEWSLKAGILPSDIEALTELQEQLGTADSIQEESKYTRKAKTMNKNTLQRDVEDEVSKISSLGVLAYIDQPAIMALFESLIPGSKKAED